MKTSLQNLLKFLFVTLGSLFISFLVAPIVATMIGMLTGALVGLFDFIANPILSFFGSLGINLEVWQIGGVIGFVGGFFNRINYHVNKN
ncbi:MAG: hypothetical protein E7004_00770 [Alphaproteobacteria bacterium]|nr:hypothetical protein [Alphaproteobacteria bacterium]